MIPRDSDKDAKKKALKTAIAQLEKDFGQGTIMKLGQNSAMEVQAVSTGSISLDMALGIGKTLFVKETQTSGIRNLWRPFIGGHVYHVPYHH